jgi:hypothetical protein
MFEGQAFHYNIPTITRPYPFLDRKYQALLQAGNCTLTDRLVLSVLGRISRLEQNPQKRQSYC